MPNAHATYTVSFENLEKSIDVVKDFLFENADKIELNIQKPLFAFFGLRNKFPEIEQYLEEEKETERWKIRLYTFNEKVKEFLSKRYILSHVFEGARFYRNDEVIGRLIAHEPIIYLNISLQEVAQLEEKGVMFRSLN